MKLLIAIPTNDMMPFQFVESLTKFIRRLDEDEVEYDVAFQGGTLVYVGRDKLVKKAMATECWGDKKPNILVIAPKIHWAVPGQNVIWKPSVHCGKAVILMAAGPPKTFGHFGQNNIKTPLRQRISSAAFFLYFMRV